MRTDAGNVRWIRALGLLLALALAGASPAAGEIENEGAGADADGRELPPLPGISMDRKAGHIELEAEVVNRDAEWLELLVCSPNTREYESILTSPARPSHIHLALLLLDLEPGAPLSWRQVDDAAEGGADARFEVQPPTGPHIAIYCIWEDADGQRHEVPANDWIRNQLTDEPLTENLWIFAGSVFHRFEDPGLPAPEPEPEPQDEPGEEGRRPPPPVYMADLNGTIVSLVNFGDDLLARPTTTTNRNDEQAWASRIEHVPPEGTAVTLRLVPTGDRSDPGDAPATRELAPDTPFVPPAASPGTPPGADD